jgi:hypothetical protein
MNLFALTKSWRAGIGFEAKRGLSLPVYGA